MLSDSDDIEADKICTFELPTGAELLNVQDDDDDKAEEEEVEEEEEEEEEEVEVEEEEEEEEEWTVDAAAKKENENGDTISVTAAFDSAVVLKLASTSSLLASSVPPISL
jgi:TATA-binding protein-associated factor Taf7